MTATKNILPQAAVWVDDVPVTAKNLTYNFLVHRIARLEVLFRVWVIAGNCDKAKKMQNWFGAVAEALLYDARLLFNMRNDK